MTNVAKTPPRISELIQIICQHVPEQCPFEKELSLIIFSTWLSFPKNPALIVHARTVGVALLVDAISQKRITRRKQNGHKAILALMDRFWPTDVLVESLLDNPWGSISYLLETTELDAAAVVEVIEFLLRCPLEYKPSLNKGLFFVSKGGFQTREEQETTYARSISTLKMVWTSYAVVSPFLYAAKLLGLPVRHLGADDPESISKLNMLLKKRQLIKRYFGLARFIQDELLKRLTLSSRANFDFVEFPSAIKMCPIELPVLDKTQLQLVKKYRAPTYVKPAQA
jgi:hypothetical protein